MVQKQSPTHHPGDLALSQRELKILCFDGGGVRGKASLLMLREIMAEIGTGAKPCDFFDLIAGTSTGSLIAIMLARLEYSVDEAISHYDQLSPQIFANVARDMKYIKAGKPLIDEGPAEVVFRKLGSVDGRDGLMYDSDGSNPRCKCMATTVLCDAPGHFIPIRSYLVDDRAAGDSDPVQFIGHQWKIWEAARAATAAPVYFKPLSLETMEFTDAGVGFNNPSLEVLHEVKENIDEYKDHAIACFVSIGTGVRPSQSVPAIPEVPASFLDPSNMIARVRELISFLSAIATDPLRVHTQMSRRMQKGNYFRFDPGPAIGAIAFTDISALRDMKTKLWKHMSDNSEIRQRMRRCAEAIKNASFAASEVLRIGPVSPIRQATNAYAWPSRVAIPLAEIVMNALFDLDSPFLAIFSVSRTFKDVVKELEAQHFLHPLNNTTETEVCVLLLATRFLDELWLNKEQCTELSRRILDNPAQSQAGNHLRKKLQTRINQQEQIASDSKNWIYSRVLTLKDWKRHAAQCAETLTFLEVALRQTDLVCECLRSTPAENREFYTFPERLKRWVLGTILHAPAESMKRCYKYFYKVAKHLAKIGNFSALHALTSAMESIPDLLATMRIRPGKVRGLSGRLEPEAADAGCYLRPLQVCLKTCPAPSQADFYVDGNILWDALQKRVLELNQFTSEPRRHLFCPENKYARHPDADFIKCCLIEAKHADDIKREQNNACQEYNQFLESRRPRVTRFR